MTSNHISHKNGNIHSLLCKKAAGRVSQARSIHVNEPFFLEEISFHLVMKTLQKLYYLPFLSKATQDHLDDRDECNLLIRVSMSR